MRGRGGQPSPGEAPLAFCDVAACFSDEEWELLQCWQKELYKKVMTEIQLAFSSLGPLIANSVFSLRPKEKEDSCSKDLEDVEKMINVDLSANIASIGSPKIKTEDDSYSIDHLDFERRERVPSGSGHVTADSDVLFTGNDFMEDMQVTSVKEQGGSPGTDIASIGSPKIKTEDESYSIDHLDFERRERNPSGSELVVGSGGAPAGVNADEETHANAVQAYRRRESRSSPSGNGSTKSNMSTSFQYHEKPAIFKSVAQKRKVNMVQNISERRHSNSQMPPASTQEQGGEKSADWQRACSALQKSTPYEWRLNKSCESTVKNNSVLCESTTPQSSKPYTHADSGQTSPKSCYVQYHQEHSLKGRYACTECGKSFGAMSNLLIHRRIHTGERPYHCTVCEKSFNQIGAFHRHQKLHTGERLHRCTVCGKGFNRKDYLQVHKKIHPNMVDDSEVHLVEIM
ncbi:uncharacterized protein LOC144807720 isoform X2 [Lissotriton helveticus]